MNLILVGIKTIGGCWSFKVPSTNIDNVWLQLCFHIITENTGNRQEVNDSVNGISFSPKDFVL